MTKRILVVEDQEDNRRILRDLLRHAGFEVLEVGDGEQALSATAAQHPDVILMDIQLPLLDGRADRPRRKLVLGVTSDGRMPRVSRPRSWHPRHRARVLR